MRFTPVAHPHSYTSIKVPRPTQHMMWFAGIRGAMAYACAKSFPNTNGSQPVIETTTMMIVLLTLFGFGTTTVPMLEYLGIPVRSSQRSTKKLLKLTIRSTKPTQHDDDRWASPRTTR